MTSARRKTQGRDRPQAVVYRLLECCVFLLAKLLFGLRIKRDPAIRRIKGPIIAIGNHASFIDPAVMACSLFGRRISFVTREGLFEKPLKRWILNQVGAIPKTQMRSDFAATRRMLRVIRAGGVLGIYPEGQRSLDGAGLPFDAAIVKLVKTCACPVVLVQMDGAYLTWPRWSRSGVRFGRIEVSTRLLIDATELVDMSVDEIKLKIARNLSFDDYQWQRQKPHAFWSMAPARGLDLFMHRCPACRKPLAMRSSRFELYCGACQMRTRLNRFGFFRPAEGRTDHWPDPQAWHRWQVRVIQQELTRDNRAVTTSATMERYAHDGVREYPIKGQMRFDSNGLVFQSQDVDIRISDILPTNMVYRLGSHFEMMEGEQLYRFTPENGRSVILFVEGMLALDKTWPLDQ